MPDAAAAGRAADLTPFGLAVGHAADAEGGTGLTVVRGIEGPFRAAAAVFGRATGTRELSTLDPDHLVDRVDAILLTGGSAFGLDAASGVMRWMAERGRGFPVGVGVVPIVPAAVVFDLAPIGRADRMPTAEMAYDACERARPAGIAEGSVGAGTGTTVGKVAGAAWAMKGGVGCAVVRGGAAAGDADAPAVAALAVVNALGDVHDADGRILAGARSARWSAGRADADGFLDARRVLTTERPPMPDAEGRFVSAGVNTTLCVVATTAPLGRGELAQLARAAGAALFRRIVPTGTTFDGDVVFAVGPIAAAPAAGSRSHAASLLQVETLAVLALEQAIERGVRLARGRDGVPGLADVSSEDTTT